MLYADTYHYMQTMTARDAEHARLVRLRSMYVMLRLRAFDVCTVCCKCCCSRRRYHLLVPNASVH